MTTTGSSHIVVTGAAGWLGLNLIEALVNGFADGPDLPEEFRGVHVSAGAFESDISKLDSHDGQIEWITSDIRDPEETERLFTGAVGAVAIHCAGLIHPRRIRELYQVNVTGTLNVIRAAAENGLKRVVVLSSNSPTGSSTNPETVFDEDSPYNPYMNYGRSKMMMELSARKLAGELNIDLVLVRAPWFYGPKQPARQATFFSMIRNGKAPVLGSGENRRSMAYVDNLSQGLLLAASVPAARGNIYWIADESSYSWNEIIDTIESILIRDFDLPCKGGRMRLPKITGAVARISDSIIQRVGFYNQKLHVLSEVPLTISCDISKARRDLDYEPRVSLREGMRRSIQSAIDAGVVI